jgi:drug/metabolite transporter (DMT)-like permease
MTYQLLVIIVLTLGFSDWEAVSHVTPNVWLMLLLLGVVSTALGHTLFAISLRVISAKSVSLISCMQPPLAIALSWLFLQEIPTINTVMGGSLILMIAFYEAIKIKASPINNTP